jgi:hypothetical protein
VHSSVAVVETFVVVEVVVFLFELVELVVVLIVEVVVDVITVEVEVEVVVEQWSLMAVEMLAASLIPASFQVL